MMETVTISGLNIDASELLEAYESGTLSDVLEDLFKDLDDEEFTAKLDEVVSAIKTAAKELDDISDGKRDEADDYADQGDTAKERSLTREADELDALVSELKDDVVDYVMDTANEIDARYIETSEDYSLSTANYDDGEVVHFNSTATAAEMEETASAATSQDDEVTDQDGDGIITYRDVELLNAAAKQDLYETGQHLYITLEEGFVVQDLLISGTTATIEAYSAAEGKTVTFLIENFNTNMRLFFNSPDTGFISNTLLSGLSEENQKLVFIGADTNSVYENLHPATDADKIAAIQNSEAMLSTDNFNEIYNQWASGENSQSTIHTATEDVMERLLTNLNYFENGWTGFVEVWADIVNNDLAAYSISEQSDILACAVMMIVKYAGQDIATKLLSGRVPYGIENIFAADGILSTKEKAISLMLETQIPEDSGVITSGVYGGAAEMWAYSGTSMSANTEGYMSRGALFGTDLEGNLTIYTGDGAHVYADLWAADMESTSESMQLYQDTINSVGWMIDDGTAASYIEAFKSTAEAEEKGYSSVVTTEYYAAFGEAMIIDGDDAKDQGQDGISTNKYALEVKAGLKMAMDAAVIGADVSSVANTILSYIAGISAQNKDHDGDVAAGMIYYLYQACPELVKAMCAEVPGFAKSLIGYMKSEDFKTDKIDAAISILKQYN